MLKTYNINKVILNLSCEDEKKWIGFCYGCNEEVFLECTIKYNYYNLIKF